VARIVELSIKENDPNCIERLFAHYEILKAIPAELPASSKVAERVQPRGGIVFLLFTESMRSRNL